MANFIWKDNISIERKTENANVKKREKKNAYLKLKR